MSKTLSERFVESFDELEDSHVSASDYMAWRRWLYWKKLKETGLPVPEAKSDEFENISQISEGKRMLHIFEDLPDDMQIDVLEYIKWLKMLEEKEDELDLQLAEECYDDEGVITIEEFMAEKASA